MRNPEKDLQDLLYALEKGQDLDSVSRAIPDENQDLVPLLHIASQIRQLTHPELSPAQASQQQEKVLAAARETFAPRRTGWKWPSKSWALSSSLVGAFILIIGFIILATAVSFATIKLNSWTTVEVVEAVGVVQAASPDRPESWQTIQSGERMREGERIRTSADATATLRFPDGSLVFLNPSTDLSFIEIKHSWSGRQSIILIQHAGDTLHEVAPFKTSNSQYRLHTPSGTASVTGTNFAVTVDQVSGKAWYSVNEGSVWVEAAGVKVLCETGQATLTQPDMAPEKPAYSFQIKGILSTWDESTLEIGNIQLNVSESILVQGKPAIGEMARAAGHIDETGVWWVDLLTSSGGKFEASFSGILESKEETVWQVSGTSLLIDANTKLTGIMEIGDAVKVDFIVQDDGQFLAIHIRPHGENSDKEGNEEGREPKPSLTVTTTSTPTITPTPTITVTVTPTITYTVTPTVTFSVTPTAIIPTTPVPEDTSCNDGEINPTAMTLAERYGVPYEEIMSWFCQGFGFGEIDLAYSLSLEYDVPVSEIFAMRIAGMGWGDIIQLLENTQPTPTEKVKEKKPTATEKVKDKDK